MLWRLTAKYVCGRDAPYCIFCRYLICQYLQINFSLYCYSDMYLRLKLRSFKHILMYKDEQRNKPEYKEHVCKSKGLNQCMSDGPASNLNFLGQMAKIYNWYMLIFTAKISVLNISRNFDVCQYDNCLFQRIYDTNIRPIIACIPNLWFSQIRTTRDLCFRKIGAQWRNP